MLCDRNFPEDLYFSSEVVSVVFAPTNFGSTDDYANGFNFSYTFFNRNVTGHKHLGKLISCFKVSSCRALDNWPLHSGYTTFTPPPIFPLRWFLHFGVLSKNDGLWGGGGGGWSSYQNRGIEAQLMYRFLRVVIVVPILCVFFRSKCFSWNLFSKISDPIDLSQANFFNKHFQIFL